MYRLSLIANKQEFVKKLSFCRFNFGNSEIGQQLDGKAEIEEKIEGNSEMLPPPAPPPQSLYIAWNLGKNDAYFSLKHCSVKS